MHGHISSFDVNGELVFIALITAFHAVLLFTG